MSQLYLDSSALGRLDPLMLSEKPARLAVRPREDSGASHIKRQLRT